MLRKRWSYGQSRSSAPKRFSVPVPETEDKSNKNVGDGKRSLIPRSTLVSSRSSSVERDGVRSSSRGTQRFARSTSVECIYVDDKPRASDYRSRSTERMITPNHSLRTPGTNACKNTVSVQKTVRKDMRPLTDRAFQLTELAKVEEYLVAKEVINRGENLCSPITLKLFVQIMNSLLCELFPGHSLTLSNYCELIPLLMRKLKYPGNVTRSWLVTANSPYAWPNVVGLLSWLVNLLSVHSLDPKFVVGDDEDDDVNCDQIKRMFDDTVQKYIEWTEKGIYSSSEENKFFDDLLLDSVSSLKDQLKETEKKAQDLENLIRQTESPEEYCAEQKLKIVKADLEKKKSARNGLREKIKNMQIALEKSKNETHTLLSENSNLKQCIAGYDCSNSVNVDDVAKCQSEVVSLQKVIKLQDTHITDINNQCYASDLVNARLQGKLDEVRLKRDAILRECISQYINTMELQLSLNYGNEDNSRILKEYLTRVKETKLFLDNISKECIEKENSNKTQRHEAEDKIKLCEADIFNMQAELQQLDLELAEIQNTCSGLERQMRIKKEEYSKLKEKETASKHNLELQSIRLADLQEEFKVLDNKFSEQKEKYIRILKRMSEELYNNFTRCRDAIRSVLSD